MRRICRLEGQLPLMFELEVKPSDTSVPVAKKAKTAKKKEDPEPVALIPPKPIKKAKPQKAKPVFQHAGPSVTLHKAGKYLLIKANDPIAADIWKDIQQRAGVDQMRNTKYFTGDATGKEILREEAKRIELWRHLDSPIEEHPFTDVLKSYGVDVLISDTLRNYMRKEARRQERENTPFPVTPIESEVKLFDRCCEGTVLRCLQDFVRKGLNGKPDSILFRKGDRYMVMSVGGEGKDHVILSTEAVKDKATLSMSAPDKMYEWTSFDPDMEDWFDDSEEHDSGPNMEVKYPELIQMMKKRLEKTGLKDKLYDHVQEDVVMMALKRGGINAYLMRMGKTSFALSWAELCGSKRVAIVGPRNARIFTVKELNRLGYKEGKDYTIVNTIEDLEKDTKFYLLMYTWLRKSKDPSSSQRKNWENYLRPSTRVIETKSKDGGVSKTETKHLTNPCPHCKQNMVRLVEVDSEAAEGDLVMMKVPNSSGFGTRDAYFKWTEARGYRCKNQDCKYITDSRDKTGINWKASKIVKHKGGYIDWGLAAHANCPDEKIKGRQCKTCGQVDSTWEPNISKRLKKRFNMVILDEIHSCKDPATDTTTATLNLRARRRLGLTGTLISNSSLDTYWPLHWTIGAPHSGFPYFDVRGSKDFEERFCDFVQLEKPIGEEVDEKTGAKKQLTKIIKKKIPFLKNPPDFWKFMASKVIRRTYDDPLFKKTLIANGRSMPKDVIIKHPGAMDAHQAQIMLGSLRDFKAQFKKMQEEADKKGQELNSALVISQMATLRVVATCPEMLNSTIGQGTYLGVAGGGKIAHIKRLVAEKVAAGGKVLILSDFLQMQKTCEAALKDFHPIRFNTGWDDEARKEAFDAFQDGEAKVFIAGTRAIREGADLSAADTCICCDMLWSPAFQTQAWSRIMTPSTRERTCEVYLMISTNSLDEHIYTVFYSKLVAAAQAMDRKMVNRRAQEFDVKWFVERVVEEERAISDYLERNDDDLGSMTMTVPGLDISELEEREV
jgi:hypothetical protein